MCISAVCMLSALPDHCSVSSRLRLRELLEGSAPFKRRQSRVSRALVTARSRRERGRFLRSHAETGFSESVSAVTEDDQRSPPPGPPPRPGPHLAVSAGRSKSVPVGREAHAVDEAAVVLWEGDVIHPRTGGPGKLSRQHTPASQLLLLMEPTATGRPRSS